MPADNITSPGGRHQEERDIYVDNAPPKYVFENILVSESASQVMASTAAEHSITVSKATVKAKAIHIGGHMSDDTLQRLSSDHRARIVNEDKDAALQKEEDKEPSAGRKFQIEGPRAQTAYYAVSQRDLQLEDSNFKR